MTKKLQKSAKKQINDKEQVRKRMIRAFYFAKFTLYKSDKRLILPEKCNRSIIEVSYHWIAGLKKGEGESSIS